ncbi:hypothetical protein CAEBREN_00811 [Caenorhabditis brenneri]|uniref:Uncharacterized protein n=1 Tax=Caenorhabditis brenneri TaxID=135651 RepID=G0MDL8_CAEBE|nr:hypothetical protein CAEBREN_00811 [Caenorhabditis brenneri]
MMNFQDGSPPLKSMRLASNGSAGQNKDQPMCPLLATVAQISTPPAKKQLETMIKGQQSLYNSQKLESQKLKNARP